MSQKPSNHFAYDLKSFAVISFNFCQRNSTINFQLKLLTNLVDFRWIHLIVSDKMQLFIYIMAVCLHDCWPDVFHN